MLDFGWTHCSSLSLLAQVSPSAPRFPSPPCSPSDDEVSLLIYSQSARQQDRGRETLSKTGIGITLAMRSRPSDAESEVVHRTRLPKRIFRDADSLAAARSELKIWTLRATRAEAHLRQAELALVDARQHTTVEHRTLQLERHDLEERLEAEVKKARRRDLARKVAESKATEAEAKARDLEEETAKYRREAQAAALKVTAAERVADSMKSKYEHLKEDFRRGGEERSRLSDEIKLLRQQVRGVHPRPVSRMHV